MRGTARERKPGVWELRAYTGRDPVTGRPRQVSRTVRGGKRAAQSALAKLVAEVGEGAHGGTKATMGALFDQWLAQAERLDRAPNTMRGYRSAIDAHLRAALGTKPVAKLTAVDLDALYARLDEGGMAPGTIRHLHGVLASALQQAVKWGWIRSSPTQLASPPKARPAEIVAPTPAEVQALVAAAEERDPNLAALLFLAALTGARRGELCGLRWSDIDIAGRTVTIERSLTDVDGGTREKSTKTGRSRRMGLDDAAVALLETHAATIGERARIGLTTVRADGYVFSPRLDGAEPYRPQNVTSFFVRIRKVAKLDHLDLHHLRHFTATQLIGAGFDARTVANRLGHANPSMTLNVYAHLFEVADRQAADHMGRVLSAKAEVPSET